MSSRSRSNQEIDPIEQAEREALERKLKSIVKPLRTAKWQADFPWHRIESALADLGKDYGNLDMNPDFQRGHVWTPEQQVHFIENCLRGVVASNGYLIQLNCPAWSDTAITTNLPEGLQCIDGLQRYTAVVEYMRGNVKPFGLTADELMKTSFSPKRFFMKVAMHDFTQRSDLLEYYLAINAGGTPHSTEEIDRVRGLLSNALSTEKQE